MTGLVVHRAKSNAPYAHFLRKALDYAARKVDDDCLLEFRLMYDRRDLS
ncbi:transposase [Bradyrhizobium sp. 131]|nr:transposase [Bradyrhizobium sp. 131]UPK20613.1 hypothetical protein IVA73_06320 [Bradyrhizobium sp. 131]